MTEKHVILVVDDTPENLRVLGDMLEHEGYEVQVATNGQDALEIAGAVPAPDLILLDIMMPEMDGYEVCRRLKTDLTLQHIPVIFISALGMAEQKVKGFREGGVDYVTKPFQAEEVVARVTTHIQLARAEELKREVAERMRAEEALKTLAEELQEKNDRLIHTQEELRNLNVELEARVLERTAQIESAYSQISLLNEDLCRRSQELEQKNQEIAEANRHLESFSYSVSHDLRAPLRHINGFVRILLEDYGQSLQEEAKKLLDRIAAGCDRMDLLTSELLQFSRFARQPISKSNLETTLLVQQVIDELDLQHREKPAELIVHDLPPCTADRQLLQQVFQNLIGNALKFSEKADHPRIEIGTLQQEGQTVFFVKDNGVGFEMQYADRLFGAFQRLHKNEDFPGTGIGLFLANNIITRHGGKVWAEAEPGSGATFFFTL
ncbi:response regulator [Geobacter pelophilus]|uniref:histidine kinase n=1 Tax=Geoanaerobacter pelophilus TaxID=60036 RepID=A0AAW4L1C2_9BACT|nr:response regulator [Geoanaerobacter pelophilus]MBT0664713.1 response regulator [Geoanaerobacter pelophilus]